MATNAEMSQTSRKKIFATRVALMEALNDPLAQLGRDNAPAFVRAGQVWTIPSDLASCGFEVSMCQRKTGWEIEIEREILGSKLVLHAHGAAPSLLNALEQLAVDAESKLAAYVDDGVCVGHVVGFPDVEKLVEQEAAGAA